MNRRRPRRESSPLETGPVDAMIVGWALSVMMTALSGGVAAIIWGFVRGHEMTGNAVLLMHYLHFSSMVAGLSSLALLAVVLKRAREPLPPRAFIAFAIVVALLPIVAALL